MRLGTLPSLVGCLLALVLGGAVIPVSAQCPPGEKIVDQLTCTRVASGEIGGAEVSDLGGSCGDFQCYSCDGSEQTGPEHVYIFTCQANGAVTLIVDSLNCRMDAYVLEDACDPFDACVAAGSSDGGAPINMVFTGSVSSTYYIILEGAGFWTGSCSESTAPYRIRFEAGAGGCPENCGNGIDDDGDELIDCDDPDCGEDPACGSSAVPEPDLPAEQPTWGTIKFFNRS